MKQLIIIVVSLFIFSGLSSCSWFPEPPDPVAQGSLTLTPLTYPDDMQAPPHSATALTIPETVDPKLLDLLETDPAPPEFDIAKANAESKALRGPETEEQKKQRAEFASTLKRNPDGNQYLIVEANFDLVWESMPDVVRNLGFELEDRDRSKSIYEIYRKLRKSKQQIQQEEDTGVERELGNRESYQIYIEDGAPEQTIVSIRNLLGQEDDSGLAKLLLVQIKAYLERSIK